MKSPEEEEDDSDVAEEKLGLSLSDGKIAEAILLFSGCELKHRAFKIHMFLSILPYLHKGPLVLIFIILSTKLLKYF